MVMTTVYTSTCTNTVLPLRLNKILVVVAKINNDQVSILYNVCDCLNLHD